MAFGDFLNAPAQLGGITGGNVMSAGLRDIAAAMRGNQGQNMLLLRQQAAMEQKRQRENQIIQRKENALNALKKKYPQHAAEIDAGYFDKVLGANGGEAKSKYANVQSDAYGNMFGLNKETQQIEMIPGARIPKGYVMPGVDSGGRQISQFYVPGAGGGAGMGAPAANIPSEYNMAPGAAYSGGGQPSNEQLSAMLNEDVALNEGAAPGGGMQTLSTPGGGTITQIGPRAAPPKPTAAEAKQFGGMEVSTDTANRISELVATNPDSKIFGLSGIAQEYATGATPQGWLVDQALDLMGEERSPADAELLSLTKQLENQVIQSMRGAAVGPKEQEMFRKQLPVPGQPQDIFMENLQQTLNNLSTMGAAIREQRGYAPQAEEIPGQLGVSQDAPIPVANPEDWEQIPPGMWVQFPDGTVGKKRAQ